ncbi:OmpA family protein [Tahibacter soli]|uniref:OmpA family protein n=1 Tax=Tahibacter soli TaxID=2983605 RepID=A0A9X3YKC1_9GAMM|nr:OmpA family protein [Tahibacter soli]MDC8012383.1 OmpA family protein [Tahibacter soli]
MKRTQIVFVALFTTLLGACASTPRGPLPEVVRLQTELDRLHGDPRIAPNAQAELAKADQAVGMLAANGRRLDRELFDHGVYIADRLVRIAEAEGSARYAEQHAQELGRERETLLTQARSRDLSIARADANAAAAAARDAQDQAAAARYDALTARQQLAELQAKETQRGTVVTLGDVLFETGRAELKPGATRSLDQLAQVLRNDARSIVSIEGHTDSVGSREYNVDLSLRRAESVRAYLTGPGGVSPSRVNVRGLGPDFPVADNASMSGRLQNRRVEVIVQNSVALR